GACFRRAAGSICGAGGALVPDTRGAVEPARAPRSDAGGEAASAAGDGPDRGRNCSQFAGGGAPTGGAGRGAGLDGAVGLQRAGYECVPPGGGTGGTALGRGGGGDRDS